MSAAAARAGDDRGSLLARRNRAVKQETAHLAPAVTEVVSVDALPAPYDAGETRPAVLDDQERATLEACERALGGLQRMYIVAGKALEVINRGRLYRETHSSFGAYVDEVWGFQRAHAYRWMGEWRLGAQLSKVSPRGDSHQVPEKHTRALMSVAAQYGEDVAVATFAEASAVAEQQGTKLTTTRVEALARAVTEQAPKTPDEARTAVRVVAASGTVPGLGQPAVPQQAGPEPSADEDQDQAADETEKQARAFAVLAALRKDVVRMPDALVEFVPGAFMHETVETEEMLRDVARAGDLMANRARNLLRSRGAGSGDE
ncbi:hypothetical protein ACIF9R_36585 [Streptomyces sp. NPDC086080]|uniref:hypothetical protein n=1 Tax=Streptomyces sp. NPDC086080 TaxID=3365748 RepID=UPI0037D916EA